VKGKRSIPRRHLCGAIGRRALKHDNRQAAFAWYVLAHALVSLETKDVPKFRDLLTIIRTAQISARKQNP